MGRVVMNGPSQPGACPACLMIGKQQQWEMYQDEIQAGYEASGEKVAVIPWPSALDAEISLGHYRAVCGEFPSLGIVDGLCWAHVAGGRPAGAQAQQVPAGLIPSAGPLPKRRRQ